MKKILISIISTNQNKLLNKLLRDLTKLRFFHKIVVTLNGECKNNNMIYAYKKKLPLYFIHKKNKVGFAENHNHVFNKFNSDIFIVLNPDIRILNFEIIEILNVFKNYKKIGLISPIILNKYYEKEDFARYFPNILTPFFRKIFKFKTNYKLNKKINYVDWVAGMFMIFRSNDFKKVNFFDPNFLLYYEDVDICLKLKKKFKKVVALNSQKITVIHNFQRASHKNIFYLYTHLKSYFYYHIKNKYFFLVKK